MQHKKNKITGKKVSNKKFYAKKNLFLQTIFWPTYRCRQVEIGSFRVGGGCNHLTSKFVSFRQGRVLVSAIIAHLFIHRGEKVCVAKIRIRQAPRREPLVASSATFGETAAAATYVSVMIHATTPRRGTFPTPKKAHRVGDHENDIARAQDRQTDMNRQRNNGPRCFYRFATRTP